MEAHIRVSGGNELEECAALRRWLQDEDELRGAISVVERPIEPTELGTAVDMLAISLGSGGMGVALSRSLTTWLKTRRSHVKVTVISDDRTVDLDATNLNADQALSLLQEALRGNDES